MPDRDDCCTFSENSEYESVLFCVIFFFMQGKETGPEMDGQGLRR